jgi:hypothetical protein
MSDTPADVLEQVARSLEQDHTSPGAARPGPGQRRKSSYIPPFSVPTFCRLVRLPGKAWAVYLAVLRQTRVDRRDTITLTNRRLKAYGLTRNDKSRALPRLERAGVIRVERNGRRNPAVTLLPGLDG